MSAKPHAKGVGKGKPAGPPPPPPPDKKTGLCWQAAEVSRKLARAQEALLTARGEAEGFAAAEAVVCAALQQSDNWQWTYQEGLVKLMQIGDKVLGDSGSLLTAIQEFGRVLQSIEKYKASLEDVAALQAQAQAGQAQAEVLHGELSPRILDATDWQSAWTEIKGTQCFNEPLLASACEPTESIRFVCISDTHDKHRWLQDAIPEGDVLVHAGDVTMYGSEQRFFDCVSFLEQQSHLHKILIAGNHDLLMHGPYYLAEHLPQPHPSAWPCGRPDPFIQDVSALRARLRESAVTYLEDELSNMIEGVAVYGSPWTPFFKNWAFNVRRGAQAKQLWQKVQLCDVLVTHGPPLGRGDMNSEGLHVGCFDLLTEIQERIHPRVHIFGHVHEADEISCDGITSYVNASTCDESYLPLRPPIVFDLPTDRSLPPRFLRPSIPWTAAQVASWILEQGLHRAWADALLAAGVDGPGIVELRGEALRTACKKYIGETGSGAEIFAKEEANFVRAVLRLRKHHYK